MKAKAKENEIFFVLEPNELQRRSRYNFKTRFKGGFFNTEYYLYTHFSISLVFLEFPLVEKQSAGLIVGTLFSDAFI